MSAQPIVYVVDDDVSVRRTLNRVLTSAGWRVETYASGTAFLNAYDASQCGCILLDLCMPGMSGLEVQAQILARGSSRPIVVVTAFGDIPSTNQAIQAGAAAVLEKPVRNQQLLRCIEQAMAFRTALEPPRRPLSVPTNPEDTAHRVDSTRRCRP